MSQYFVQLDSNNTVTDIAVTTMQFMAENPDRYPGRWVETFFDTPGKTYAGIGFTYDEEADDFIAPVYAEPLPDTE
jgi:hypothetical protein